MSTVSAYPTHVKPWARRFFITREMGIIYLLLAAIILSSVFVNKFFQGATIYYLCLDILPSLLIALPMTMVMITGDIDISVGSMLGLSCSLLGLLYSLGVPYELGMVAALSIGLLGGLLNGLLVTKINLPALAVTIGTLALFRGISVGLLGTKAVTNFPERWTNFAKMRIPGTDFPVPILIFVALLVVFVILLHFTTFGRGVYAIGLNKEAAVFSGVNEGRTRTILFVLAGGMAALSGIFYTMRFGTARGDAGEGLELQVIAAIVLGGVSVFGGRGAMHGAVAGVVVIGVLSAALRLLGVASDVIKIITGTLLILSVVVGALLIWIGNRRVPKTAL